MGGIARARLPVSVRIPEKLLALLPATYCALHHEPCLVKWRTPPGGIAL